MPQSQASARPASPASSRRRWAASIFLLGTAAVLAFAYRDAAYYRAAWAFPPLLMGSALLVHARALSAQLLVRGLWWATALVGTALAYAWWGSVSANAAAVAALGSSLGLLALGSSSVLPEGKTIFFVPRAGRATFTAALLFAAFDALALGYFGVLYLESLWVDGGLATSGDAFLLLGLAAASGLAAIGLFTLRVWAWLGAVLSSAAIGGLALAGALPLPVTVATALAAIGGLAVLTQVPLVARLARGRGV